jgi:putative Mg2+ transporter-C (MgtC) family protein
MAIPLDIGLTRLVVSLVLGGLIGMEREIHRSPAGLRTMALVSVGSTLYTLASVILTGQYVDISRIAAQIVLGVGFIGGGVIFQAKHAVHGLTTAACMWTVAAIGLMVGIGEYVFATVTSIIIILVLWFGTIEKKVLPHEKM